jgi:hypothetical protein
MARPLNLKRAVAGLEMAHLPKITSSFELSVLTLTAPALRLRKIQNPFCYCVPVPFLSSLTAESLSAESSMTCVLSVSLSLSLS